MSAENSSCFVPVMLLLCFLMSFHLTFGADSIVTNQAISGNQTIVSSGGNFELGFFQAGNSSKYYVGIWFKKVSDKTVVWVANRERPVMDKYSSELKLVDGNLVLLDEKETEVWSTDTNFKAYDVEAVLLDEGNLVLRNGSKRTLWQSWDWPSDTWLPGSKIGYDKRTNRKQILTSWKNPEDPTPGMYTLELDPIGNQYIIRGNRSQQIWASGAWKGQIFSNVPEMGKKFLFNFNYTTTETEVYFTYSLINTSPYIARFIMDYTGQIKQLTWLDNVQKWFLIWSEPKTQCEVNAYCGAYGVCNAMVFPVCDCLPGFKGRFEKSWSLRDYSGGCERITKLEHGEANTGNLKADIFGEYRYMKLPDNPQLVSAGNATDCKSICLSRISCTAYAYYADACSTWRGDLFNMQQLAVDDINGKVIYIRLHASKLSKNNKGIIPGAIGGSIAVVIVMVSLILIAIKKRKLGRATEAANPVEGTVVAFGFKDLQTATKNFSEMLGRGSFGSVFKGTLPDSTVIAVKKLEGIRQGEKQFRNEISTIGFIQHVNLVHLRGFCSEGNKKLLVYEYASNGSLDSHIFNKEKSKSTLSWRARYEIALGTARGLVYLHENCRDCIIHCDVKPENILLDTHMCPKVADFGLAKLVGRDFSRVLTTMRGTRGYLAPEWLSGAPVTAKADVYSYGMMLFEFVSGRRNVQHTNGKINFFPTSAAKVIINGGDILDILDPNLNQVADVEEVTRICRVACWCIQDDENIRPSMGQVVQILEGVLSVDLPPDPRVLQVFLDNEENVVFFTDESSSTVQKQYFKRKIEVPLKTPG
ncbi:hypothetical protein ACET3Z_009881 [Daucus carota]